MVQWLRLPCSHWRGSRFISVQGTRSYMSQLKPGTIYCCCLVAMSCPTLLWPPRTVAWQAPLFMFMEFPRQEYWSGLPFPCPGDLPDPGIKPKSPALAGRFFFFFYWLSHQGSPSMSNKNVKILIWSRDVKTQICTASAWLLSTIKFLIKTLKLFGLVSHVSSSICFYHTINGRITHTFVYPVGNSKLTP